MRAFLILSIVAVAQGRPEAGYNYRPAGGNIGFQQGGGGGGFQQSLGGSFSQSSSASSSFGGGGGGGGTGFGNSGYAGGGSGFSGGSGFGGQGAGIGFSQGGSSGFGGQGASIGFSQGGSSGFSGTSGGQGYFSGGAQEFGGASIATGGQTLVQKHIYVHVPPPEPEEFHAQRQISAGIAQKHYKIIFIKAPSPPSPTQQQIALAAQNQEKTIVYVLVKKPEELEDIALPSIAPTQPSKPEVYFIKYKTQKQITGGGASINAGGIGIGTGSGVGLTGIGGTGHGSAIGGIGISGGGSISTGASGTSSLIGSVPTQQYGPPGKSGPY